MKAIWKPISITLATAILITGFTGCAKHPHSAYPDNITCQRIQSELATAQQRHSGPGTISIGTQSRLLNQYRKAGCSPLG